MLRNDKPINECTDDQFKIKDRLVKPIIQFLNDNKSCSIAVSGEWGAGKSSVLNLLKKELVESDGKVIIQFEPLLEGGRSLPDILKLFYLKLDSAINCPDVKSAIIDILENIALLADVDLTFSIPKFCTAGVNPGKLIKRFINKLKNNNTFSSYQDKANNINKALSGHHKHVLVMIDEIDRMDAAGILNFLMFSRTFELFDSISFVFGLNYTEVINKLISSPMLSGLHEKGVAKNYLDKLFTHIYTIKHDVLQLSYFAKQSIDNRDFLEALTSFKYGDNGKRYTELVGYLETPRSIKKWSLYLTQYKDVLKHELTLDIESCWACIRLLAIRTKDQIIYEKYVTENGSTTSGIVDDDKYLTQRNRALMEEWLPAIKANLNNVAGAALQDSIPANEYYDIVNFFKGGDSQESLTKKLLDTQNGTMLLNDIHTLLSTGKIDCEQESPLEFDFINSFWEVVDHYYFGETTKLIPMYCLIPYKVTEILDNVYLSLSESFILFLLSSYDINLIQGRIDLAHYNEGYTNHHCLLSKVAKNSKKYSLTQDDLKNIINSWITEVKRLYDNNDFFLHDPNIVTVMYRYDQLVRSVDEYSDNSFVDDKLKLFIENPNVDDQSKVNAANQLIINQSINAEFKKRLQDIDQNFFEKLESISLGLTD